MFRQYVQPDKFRDLSSTELGIISESPNMFQNIIKSLLHLQVSYDHQRQIW